MLAVAAGAIGTRAAVVTLNVKELEDEAVAHAQWRGQRVQSYALKVGLRSFARADLESVSVKYWYIGEDQQTRRKYVVFEGEQKVGVLARGSQTEIETEACQTKYSRKKNTNEGYITYVSLKSGIKIKGYVIRVYAGGELLATEASSRRYERAFPKLLAEYEREKAKKAEAEKNSKRPRKKRRKKDSEDR